MKERGVFVVSFNNVCVCVRVFKNYRERACVSAQVLSVFNFVCKYVCLHASEFVCVAAQVPQGQSEGLSALKMVRGR